MNILNFYFSSTGNTEKVAKRIEETGRKVFPSRRMRLFKKRLAGALPGSNCPS